MNDPVSPRPPERVVEEVRDRYGRIATGEIPGCGCACDGAEAAVSRSIGYSSADLSAVPDEANLGLGCGAPVESLHLSPGETVVDLGSGGGIDAFLAARAVGPGGRVIGVDMTPEMLDRARAAAARHGFRNVDFREGRLEALPVEDASVDAVTSNCVINLVPEKAAVFREIARVLRPGGRMVVSDIVLDRRLPEALAKDVLAWVGCVAGAELRTTYFSRLEAAGLSEIEVLRDVDYAASLARAAPAEADALLGRLGSPSVTSSAPSAPSPTARESPRRLAPERSGASRRTSPAVRVELMKLMTAHILWTPSTHEATRWPSEDPPDACGSLRAPRPRAVATRTSRATPSSRSSA